MSADEIFVFFYRFSLLTSCGLGLVALSSTRLSGLRNNKTKYSVGRINIQYARKINKTGKIE